MLQGNVFLSQVFNMGSFVVEGFFYFFHFKKFFMLFNGESVCNPSAVDLEQN